MKGFFYILSIFAFCFLAAGVSEPQLHKPLSSISNLPPDSVPRYPDIFYEYRIAELNRSTPIELEFNDAVKYYIELYSIYRRDEFARILGLSKLYFPLFDEALDRHSLPLELKYITVIESGLNPLAVSKSGATGLWQFLFNTCKLFDLHVDSYVDERRDPYKSTEAACKYFTYLYNTFHDWQLVISSFNGGPGEIRKAIERSHGETNYWKLRPYLSDQTKNYVPAFIAIVYLMNYYKEHNIVPVPPEFDFQKIDTLHIAYAVTFNQIASIINLPTEEIRFLNPTYTRDEIPEIHPWALLVLPTDKILPYLKNETSILGFNPLPDNYNQLVLNAGDTKGKIKLIHVVQPGEFTHKIAIKYNCTLENIKAWNGLNDNNVYPGQKLIIWVNKDTLQNN